MRIILKLLLILIVLAMTLIQWVGIVVTSLSKTLTKLISGLLFTVAVIGYLLYPDAGLHAVNIMVLAFMVFILPHVTRWIVYRITDLNYSMRKFIRS